MFGATIVDDELQVTSIKALIAAVLDLTREPILR
jgi:hypothetical protein